jgi:hypothetical protein
MIRLIASLVAIGALSYGGYVISNYEGEDMTGDNYVTGTVELQSTPTSKVFPVAPAPANTYVPPAMTYTTNPPKPLVDVPQIPLPPDPWGGVAPNDPSYWFTTPDMPGRNYGSGQSGLK